MSRPIASAPIERALGGKLRLQGGSLLACAGYILTYVLLDGLSYIQPVLKLGITPWNPQAGLTLAFLLAYGPRWAPATAIAALASEVLIRGGPSTWPVLMGAAAWIACVYAGLAALLRRWGMPQPLESTAFAARLAIATAVATLCVALGYVRLFIAAGALPGPEAGSSVARYWVGDFNGILTLTPLLLLVTRWRSFLRTLRASGGLVAAQFAAVVIVMWIVFGPPATDQLRLFYLLFVPMIWITLRWGVPGAVLSTLTIQVGLIIAVQDETGAPPLTDLQYLLVTLSLTALLLGTVVTERAEALKRVATREAEQRVLLRTAPDAVLTIDSAGRIRSANPAASAMFGPVVNPLNGTWIRKVLPAVRLHQPHGRATVEGLRVDGSSFPAEIAWAQLDTPVNGSYLVIVRDASQRQQAQSQLREREVALSRAMRFAVAGELASALAHELNQPITALVSYLQASEILAAPLVLQDHRLQDTLGKATHEAIRASEVLRRLRDFYRGGLIKRECVQLSFLCTTFAETFSERIRRAGADLEVDVPASLPSIEAGATQLEIVLHNLLSNAIDAVSTQEPASRHVVLRAEGSETDVTLQVEDSGSGVNEEILSKLFEPFVTTKADGMGLGLVISRSLLRGQGGDLLYVPGRRWGGACFVVRLPRQLPAPLDN